MRVVSGMFALLAFVGFAGAAEERRHAPPVGAELTYKIVVSTQDGAAKRTQGFIYTYVVTSSDGLVSEGRIRFVARGLDCQNDLNLALCKDFAADPKSYQQGGLTFVAIPAEQSEALMAKSGFKVRYFFFESRRLPIPTRIASSNENPVVLSYTWLFDAPSQEALARADTEGRVLLNGTAVNERSGGGANSLPPKLDEGAVSIEVTRKPDERVTLASGEWDAQDFVVVVTPKSGVAPNIQAEVWFSEKLGAVVETRSTTTGPNGAVGTSHSELVAARP